ncbi:MAG: hypothetical protein HY866_20075 [Chloroflexi bacterium]|nr:hypothetical protein [Chloroflexota bacterium]
MRTLCLFLLFVLCLFAALPAAAQQEGHALIYIDVCRVAGSNDYAATFSNIGTAALHVGYDLRTNPGVAVDVGLLEPGQSITARIHLADGVQTGMNLMYLDDHSTWQYSFWYRYLDGSLNYRICSAAGLPDAAPAAPAGAPDCGNGNGLALVQFETDTPLYYQASPDAQTDYAIPAGSTAWLTLNTVDFSAVRWACMTLWVPVGSIQ